MNNKNYIKFTATILFFITSCFCFSQTITGVVLDAKTQEPIESASVYFDNTTIGTSTNNQGNFEISIKPGINSALVISFLGYEKIIIPEYNLKQFYKILLVEDDNPLDEVLISYFDGMSKETKLNFFREQFLGKTPNAQSCTILNEDDVVLRFNKKKRQLTATSKRPIIVENKNLQYNVEFDIKEFKIDYSYVDVEKKIFRLKSVLYFGTTFFKDLNKFDSIANNNRKESYKGSILHFMRALSNETLNSEGYQIFSKSFIVEPSKYINVRPIKDTESVLVKLRLQLSILYNEEQQSEMVSSIPSKVTSNNPRYKPLSYKDGDTIKPADLKKKKLSQIKKPNNSPYYNTEIIIDSFGNYSPIGAFYFIGHMGNLRIGDTLPLDYILQD